MSGYTKGPWQIDRSGNIYGSDRRFVCSANGSMSNLHWEDHQAENDANANLIAAAPDMYEALKGVLHAVDIGLINIRPQEREVFGQLLTEVNAAISKAKGE